MSMCTIMVLVARIITNLILVHLQVNLYEKKNEAKNMKMDYEDDEDVIEALNGPLNTLKQNGDVKSSVPFTHASFPLSTTMEGQSIDICEYVEQLILKYVHVIRGQVSDFVPKCIMFHMFDCCLNGKFKDAIVSSCLVLCHCFAFAD
jgi:hypothetical protein